MTSKWLPSLESWGLPDYFGPEFPSAQNDLGPIAVGRVVGSEIVAVEDALNRVLAAGITAIFPVPRRPLAAVCGAALRSQDTQSANPKQPLVLPSSFRVSHCLGDAENEPPLLPKRTQIVEPFGFLLPGADAVLDTTSPCYGGTTVYEKTDKKIIAPVPAGTNVINPGADLQQGTQLLSEGRRVTPGDIAAMCVAGIKEVYVFSRPRVAICIIDRYFRPNDGEIGSDFPDGVSPLVRAMLGRWGVKVDTVQHFDFRGRKFANSTNREISLISEDHDLTIVVGFLGDDSEISNIVDRSQMRLLAEPHVNEDGPDASYLRHRASYRPADISKVFIGGDYLSETPRADRCKVIIALQGLPLPVFTAMYTVVKPTLDALGGVGAFPIQSSSKFAFASPRSHKFSHDERRELLSRPEKGMSGRHGVLWLSGVLAAPAPRDGERHWLQLAKVVRNEVGQASLQVLPSEEYQVSGLAGADAMVGIEKGEGDLPAGTAVEYFMLD
jgi:molybdopterin biosynthesis enzyme